jgi:hypothetical protein
MNGAHFGGENTTVSRQSKMVRVPVIQKYSNSDQILGLGTVGIDGGWSLKLPEHLTQESRGNNGKQRFVDAPQTHLYTVVYPIGTNVKSFKWRSDSVKKCVLDTILLSWTICYSGRQFEFIQIRWSSSSFTMSKLFGLTKAETRNYSFKKESLCLIGGRPARTSHDITCVDLIRPKQIRPALHCIRSSPLIWQSGIPEKHTPPYSIMLGGHPKTGPQCSIFAGYIPHAVAK